MAKASPPAPRKENATGKTQQLSGRKESSAVISDPPEVTATLDGFIALTSLLYSKALLLSPLSPPDPVAAHSSRRRAGASRSQALRALSPIGLSLRRGDIRPKPPASYRASFATLCLRAYRRPNNSSAVYR